MKKLFSMFLALSMVFTLPVGMARAQETHTDIGASREIIALAPFDVKEKSVTIGTSTQALELPQIAESVNAETMGGLISSMSIVEYNLWVGGTRVNSANMTDVLGNGTVSCTKTADSNEFTLTLNGANITGAYSNGYYKSGIYAIGTLNIILADGTNNTVTGTTNTGNISSGIYVTDQLSFSGGGSLTVSGGTATSSYGLYCSNDYSGGISFWGTGAIIVQGGTAVTESYGMFAKNFIMVLDGTVTAKSISTTGTAQAMNHTPANLSSNYSITAGANESGAVTIDNTSLSANYRTYKFLSFTQPAPTAPTATTENATSIMATTATLNGIVNANYGSTTVGFQYGTSTSYGSYVTATQSPVAGSNDTSVSYELTGLAPGTTYHYRTVAVNSVDTTYGSDKTFTTLTFPRVTASNISFSGATGTGGAYKIGDTLTVRWNNTSSGDNNSGITSVTMDFSQFGGGTAVIASNSGGTWTAVYTITAGSIDTTNRNVLVTATSDGGSTTTASNTNLTVDNIAPRVTSGNITLSGGSGPGGIFKLGDTVTATWNNTIGGDNNSDTISSVTVNFSAFGGGAMVPATNSSGTWTATYAINPASSSGTGKNVSVTATDNAGNRTTTNGSTAATVDTTTTVTHLDLTGKLNAPAKNAVPSSAFASDAQYTGSVTWNESPAKFLGGTAYSATVMLTANTGYTFTSVAVNSFSYSGANVTNAAGSGNTMTLTIAFPTTVARALQSIAITKSPNKMVYKFGETFNPTGMVVKATYDDGTEDTNFNAFVVDKTNPLNMDDTTITLTATANSSITTTLNIIINKGNGPAAPSNLIGLAPTTLDGTDGKITGTTTSMEYASNTGFTSATDCTTTEITSLTAGIYYVRVKTTTTHEAGAYATVNVPAGVTKIAVPTARIGLKWNNSLQGGVSGGTGYTLSGDYQATEVGSYTATATLQPGYVWNDNTTIPKTITWSIAKADSPAAPTDLSGVSPTTLNGTDGKITGTTTLMEYASNTGFTSATDCTTTEITSLTAGIYYVRVKATTTHEAGAYATVNVPVYVPNALTGSVTIGGTLKYGQTLTATYGSGNNTGALTYQWKRGGTDGIIIGTNSNTYTVEAADINQTLTCVITSDLQAGPVYGITSATIGKADGPTVSGVSTVGCTTVSNNDGKLTGMTTAMEYKKIGDANYTAVTDSSITVTGSAITVTGSAITGLTNGDYLVRVAETDTHYAGADSSFTVGAFIPAPTYTISGTITGSDTNNGIAGAVVQLKSGSGNIGSSVPTDSNGAYTISNVPAGTYTILVSAIGYDSGTISSFDLSGSDVINQNLTLTKTIVFIPVTDITMNNATSIQVNTNLILTGTMTPGDATNRTMAWSVENANGTGATITGDIFRATSAGTATVKVSVANGLTTSSDYTKTFTITVTAAPIPVPDPVPGPGPAPSPVSAPSNTKKSEGTVEKTQQQEDGAPAVNVNNNSNELKTSVLTPQEQEMVASGEKAKVILKVTDIGTSVRDEEKKLIQEKLAIENGVLGSGASDIPILYVDLSLYKQVGSQEQTKVTETNGNISISIEVPKSFWNLDITKNRAFYVIRIHDGKVTRIEGSYDAQTHLFTFESDRFSTYALTYQDTSGIQPYHDFHHLQLTAKADKTSQTLSYQRISNVDGYLIYGSKCGEEMIKLADVSADITSYTVKKLKQGTYYKYQVKAYRIIDGKQVVIMSSKVLYSITESKKYGNPTKVTTDSTSVKLAEGKSTTAACQLVLPKDKKLKEHTAAIRYESSNELIATVNSKGKITAKAKGSCYVYAYAQNGVNTRIKVTVE